AYGTLKTASKRLAAHRLLTLPRSPVTHRRHMTLESMPFAGSVEFSPGFKPRPDITHVLFDFDGTLSLIREGWPAVMTPMFVEMLPPLPGESEEERRKLCLDDIMRLTGKQTIYQMIQLADRIKERGG